MIEELDSVIRQSLSEFVSDIFQAGWLGREREAVSLYVLGYLIRYCKPNCFLRDPTQIGIEVAVPQLRGPNKKKQVCKDLVIWRQPRMTCWNSAWEPVEYPTAILEWKVYRAGQASRGLGVSRYDIAWLGEFSVGLDDFVGYAVSLDLRSRKFRLLCTRVHDGQPNHRWLHL